MKRCISVFAVIALMFMTMGASCQSPNPNPNPISDPQCAVVGCETSQICKIGGPSLIFGAAELGIAIAVIEDPSIKKGINTAYAGMEIAFQSPNLTWGQVVASMTSQIAPYAGKWGPLIQVVIQRLGTFVSTDPVSDCDRAFLMQHCVNALAISQGIAAPYLRVNQSKLNK